MYACDINIIVNGCVYVYNYVYVCVCVCVLYSYCDSHVV